MPASRGSRHTGRFRYDVAHDAWEWDDDVYRVHGFEPGSVVPTTELVWSSKHAEDRGRVRAAVEQAMVDGEPFNIYYRLVGHDGRERRVVLAGEGETAGDGTVTALQGYYVDLTPDFEVDSAEVASAAVSASAESRATIEQAKGALMLVYGLDADAAFAMLRWWSRNRNLKVRDVAERLLEVMQGGDVTHAGLRHMLDALLDDLTADPDVVLTVPEQFRAEAAQDMAQGLDSPSQGTEAT